MTSEELQWIHRLETRMEIEGLEVGQRIIARLAASNAFVSGHRRMLAMAARRIEELRADFAR